MKKQKRKLPQFLRKGNSVYQRTRYGSYVDLSEYGMAQQKNARSYIELKTAGYK